MLSAYLSNNPYSKGGKGLCQNQSAPVLNGVLSMKKCEFCFSEDIITVHHVGFIV
jgi:hypothetical protein